MGGALSRIKPACPNCGKPMQLVPASARLGLVPELPIFGCRLCEMIEKETADSAERELT